MLGRDKNLTLKGTIKRTGEGEIGGLTDGRLAVLAMGSSFTLCVKT